MKLFLKKTRVMIMVLGALLMLFSGCGTPMQVTQKVDTAMGTIVSQTLYASNGDALAGEIIAGINLLEREMLSWRIEGSEIYVINKNAGKTECSVLSEKLMQALRSCMEVSEASGGVFDITMGKVVRLWDIDSWAVQEETTDFSIPEEAVLQAALANTGYEQVVIKGNDIMLPENFQLDMGAVGKGIALDEIIALLKKQENVAGAVISVGGSILTYGSKPEGGAWNVGIVNPGDTSQNIGVLKLVGEWCVSTSGDYERYVEVDGTRYHHIIDPQTGKPADSGISSVTILCKEGLYSDALSTACFVLGEEKGMELAEQFDAEALFIKKNGEITMTEGMEQYFHLSNTGN